ARTQVLVDGLGLGGALDDHQLLAVGVDLVLGAAIAATALASASSALGCRRGSTGRRGGLGLGSALGNRARRLRRRWRRRLGLGAVVRCLDGRLLGGRFGTRLGHILRVTESSLETVGEPPDRSGWGSFACDPIG